MWKTYCLLCAEYIHVPADGWQASPHLKQLKHINKADQSKATFNTQFMNSPIEERRKYGPMGMTTVMMRTAERLRVRRYDTRHNPVRFDGSLIHGVEPFEGTRGRGTQLEGIAFLS